MEIENQETQDQETQEATNTEESQETSQAETQQVEHEPAADTTEIPKTTEELGITKSETQGDDQEDFGEEVNALVAQALAGKLSDEDRSLLDKAGIGHHFDMIVEGYKAKQAANDQEIYSVVGGKESYAELQEWALSNLNEQEINSFNNAVLKSGDIGLAKLAVEGLQARYAKVNGQAPQKVLESGSTSNEGSRPFSSVDEYINETMSVKYKTDPEYAAKVEAKRNLSGF